VNRPFCVALTGGIGSGKSAVADLFASHGVKVVDTDRIAHELTGPGGAAMMEIAAAFGPDSVAPDGSLDRAWMHARVFADGNDTARRCLEGILHPRIRQEAERRVAAAEGAYVILVVPLLVESGAYGDIADRVLVVDCAETTQLARILRRDGHSRERARAIIAAQASRQARLASADDVMLNEAGLADLTAQVAVLHARYLDLALYAS
jgi:dephospho-CoA kinase